MKCKKTIEFANELGQYDYHICGKPVKYRVKYVDSLKGKLVEDEMCGVHFNSLKKWAKRLMKKAQYDVKLEYHKIQ